MRGYASTPMPLPCYPAILLRFYHLNSFKPVSLPTSPIGENVSVSCVMCHMCVIEFLPKICTNLGHFYLGQFLGNDSFPFDIDDIVLIPGNTFVVLRI